ncbi:MAG: dihydrofolate reductase family protein, partial [Flavobacteriaceae bacterium]|nr:dihydrofolate reductase family protein [Flavobacteriaceae bacterium]
FEESVIEQLLSVLQQHEIQSVIVEGGKQLLESFINLNYWDEARVFVGINSLKNGIEAPKINGLKKSGTAILEDTLLVYKAFQ